MADDRPKLFDPASLELREATAPPGTAPVDYITGWLRRRMPEVSGHRGAAAADRVLVVQARTGSGKSTVLPVAVFRILRAERTPAARPYHGPSVICTQPRVLTAMTLARDVSSRPWNPDMVLGQTVGFATGPASARPAAGLVYATAGVLAAQLRRDTDAAVMAAYRFILVDEAHERSIDCDVTLMLLRDFYARNAGDPRLPFLLLLSATFDPDRYAEYFGVGPANVVGVSGRAFPITDHWPDAGANDYPAEAAAVALRIHEAGAADPPARADVLVFMPGGRESAAVAERLRAYRPPPGGRPFLVLEINREVVASQAGDFLLLFERPERLPDVGGARPARRVIVSTIVAETGLTIDTLRYVVDAGWVRTTEVYPPWGARGLVTRPAARSRVEQRRGRAGRLFAGDFYPLYTENVHAALDAQQLPDIVTAGVGEHLLALVAEQQRQKLRAALAGAKAAPPPEFRVEDVALLDPPPPEAYLAAAAAATSQGFLAARAPLPTAWPPPLRGGGPAEAPLRVARGYGLTPLGFLAAGFARTPPAGARALLAGYMWGAAASDLATAAAAVGTPLDRLYARGAPPGAALRAALPAFFGVRGGGAAGAAGGAPADEAVAPGDAEAAYYRARLVIADDFAEAVLLFDAFAGRLEEGPAAAAAWCEGVGLAFDALVELARRREDTLAEAVAAGLDPFRLSDRRLAALPLGEFTDGVRRFKRCLYDGMRETVLRYDEAAGAYATRQGMRVRAPPLFGEAAARQAPLGLAAVPRPRWLLTDQVRLAPAPRRPEDAGDPLLYVAAAGLVSVLDGYVDVDDDFGEPRSFGPDSL